jgi:hypothetical protein
MARKTGNRSTKRSGKKALLLQEVVTHATLLPPNITLLQKYL